MNGMSIDLEDWYHCLDQNPSNWHTYQDRIVPVVFRLLEIFEQTRTHVTFFVLGHVAERNPDVIFEIHRAGHEIASHGYWHRFVFRLSPKEFATDVEQSVRLLKSITGEPVLGYRAPYFSITRRSLWALPILRKLGFEYDSSIFPVLNHRYGIPNAPRLPHRTESGLMEVPLSTFPISKVNLPCSGGVYLRILPYRLTRGLLRQLRDRGEPLVCYLHPWEIDADQPRIPLPAGLKLRHYWGLHRLENKLRQLLQEFAFGPMKEFLKL